MVPLTVTPLPAVPVPISVPLAPTVTALATPPFSARAPPLIVVAPV
jgi:hypothetical protein